MGTRYAGLSRYARSTLDSTVRGNIQGAENGRRSQRGVTPMTEPRFEVKPSISDHFSWMRTQMSLQRTLMSATRTSVSLIGFGFTVAQFFEHLRDRLPERVRNARPDIPRNLGLLLIAAG